MRVKLHYGWIILAVCFFGVLAAQGLRYSFGAFMAPWENQFSVSRGAVSAISFISFMIFALSQPIIGKLIDLYGVKRVFVYSTIILGAATILTYFATSIWMLLILYGVIASLGFGGASGVTASLAVTRWFHKKQGLALGLVEAGFGAGQMVMVSASLFLIDKFGWKITVLFLGGFLLLVVSPILAIFLKSDPSEIGVRALGEEEAVKKESATNKGGQESLVPQKTFLFQRSFWFLMIPYFICGVTTTGLIDTHFIPLAQYCGFSVAETGTAVSLLALFNTGGTVASGFLADKINNRTMVASVYFFRGLTILFLFVFTLNVKWLAIFIAHPWLLFLFSITFGIVDFAVVAPTIKMLSQYFQGPSLGTATGFLYMSHQFGSAVGSYFPGVLFDRTGNYTSSLATAAALLALACLLSACLPKSNTVVMKKSAEYISS